MVIPSAGQRKLLEQCATEPIHRLGRVQERHPGTGARAVPAQPDARDRRRARRGRGEHFDLALLDVNLGDHTSEAVAERLQALQVPTIVATGYSETDDLPAALRSRPHVCKPYGRADLERVLGAWPADRAAA